MIVELSLYKIFDRKDLKTMNMRKLTLLLSLILTLCISAVVAYAENETNPEAQRKAGVLYDLGIIEDDSIGEEIVTRGEFASMVVKMMGEEAIESESAFSDVESSEFADAISTVCNLGLMSGYDEATFGADDPVTYIQVLKTLVTMAGYQSLAEVKGGFPMGYISVADDRRIVKAKVSGLNEAAKRSDVFTMLYDLLRVNVFEMDASISAGSTGFDKFSYGDEFCYDKLGLTFGEGIVSGNTLCNLVNDKELSENDLLIDSVVVTVKGVNVIDSLGRYAEYFIDEDNNAVSFCYNDKEVEYIEIDARDIASNDGNVIKYTNENNSSKSISFSGNAKIVYNGSLLITPKETELNPKEGRIRAVKTKGNGYDLMVITSVKSMIVEEANETRDGYTLIFENGDTTAGTDVWNISSSDFDKFIVVLNDTITDVKSISKGMTIDIAAERYHEESGFGVINRAVIYASTEAIPGKVNEISVEEMIIDENIFELSANLPEQKLSELNVGDVITAYINSFGRIAWFELKVNTEEMYCYLRFISTPDIGVNQAHLKVINEKGKLVVLETNEKVGFTGYVNNEYINTRIDAEELVGIFKSGNTVNRQLIKIKLDEDGFVTKVITANEDSEGDMPGYAESGFNLNKKWIGQNAVRVYQEKVSSLNSNYSFDGNTIVFRLSGNMETEDEIKVGNNTIVPQDTFFSNVKVYDADEMLKAKVVLILEDRAGGKGLGEYDYKANATIVNSVTKIIDDNDNIIYKLKGIKNGEEIILYSATETLADGRLSRWANIAGKTDETAKFANLKRGDVFLYAVDEAGDVDAIDVIHYAGQYGFAEYVNGDTLDGEHHRAMIHTAFGKVTSKPNSKLIWVESQTGEKAYQLETPAITVYDVAANEVYPGTAADIVLGDYVLIKDAAYNETDVVVYKHAS